MARSGNDPGATSLYARLIPSTRGNPVARFCLSSANDQGSGLLMYGGAVPTWYEVTPATAARLRDVREQGRSIVEIVTGHERQSIEDREMAERAAAIVLAQRVAPLAVSAAPVVPLSSGRDAALVGEATGAITTADLPAGAAATP